MNFVKFCVSVVISIICFFGSMLIAFIASPLEDNDELGYFSSLVISDIVIGILITVLLMQNNII